LSPRSWCWDRGHYYWYFSRTCSSWEDFDARSNHKWN